MTFSMTTLFILSWVMLGLHTMAVDLQSSNMETHKPTVRPVFSGRPFMVAWNAPTQNCQLRYNVSFDLRLFDINSTPTEGIVDQNLTLFYKKRLGLYPFYDEYNVSVNGGVPQNASLRAHLDQMLVGINKYMPSVNKTGLGVIDWEEWRPIWVRNWNKMDIYRQASRQLVASRYPNWTNEKVNKEAQNQFEKSAREFMVETLLHAKKLRPRQLWGYYLYPDCHNYDYSTNWNNYTGKCPNVEMMDLISTLGESAAQGAAGVIFWGDAEYAKNKETCQNMTSYLDGDLGQYIVNVTTAASLCSQTLCGGNGRCLRKENATNAYLHLNPANFCIVRAPSGSNASLPMWAEGQLSSEDITFLRAHFRCQCYLDSPRRTCGFRDLVYNGTKSSGSTRDSVQSWILMVLLLMLLDW
ncbi:hyaluronidase-2-like isoform X2 [Aquarana catesbeiana]|uniref:hyaluronidase-2-like isoform X2 n=1 Tax=Aquarana catesbeiana TaxID=8400 RepID=UPI003CC99AAE